MFPSVVNAGDVASCALSAEIFVPPVAAVTMTLARARGTQTRVKPSTMMKVVTALLNLPLLLFLNSCACRRFAGLEIHNRKSLPSLRADNPAGRFQHADRDSRWPRLAVPTRAFGTPNKPPVKWSPE